MSSPLTTHRSLDISKGTCSASEINASSVQKREDYFAFSLPERGGNVESASDVALSIENLTNHGPEPWEIVSNDFPYEFQVDPEILVHQDVSQT